MASASPVATTPEGLLRTACLVGAGQARRDVAAARATAPGRPLEAFGAALAEGRSSRAHVDVAVRCLDRIPESVTTQPGAPDRIVGFLQEAAAGVGPLDMDRAARQLLTRLVPDRADRFDADAHRRRFLDLHTDDTGMVVGSFQLDAVAGASFRAALDHHSAPAAGADGEPDRRTARQRRADALAGLSETALGVGVPRRGERPRVVVHLTPAQLAGTAAGRAETEDGEPLSTATTGRLVCDAVLQRVVTDPSAGPLDVGRAHRLVTLAQRRALEGRDRGCIIPGCGAAAAWCDAHHIVPWAAGGATDLPNLCLLCPGHHTAVHVGSWQVLVQGGHLVVVPPRWVDPTRTPRPVPRHRMDSTLRDLDEQHDLDEAEREPDLHPDAGLGGEPGPAPQREPVVHLDRDRGADVHVVAAPWSWCVADDYHRRPHVDLSVGPVLALTRDVLRRHAHSPP